MQVIAGPAGPQNIGSSSLRVFYFRDEVCQPSFTEQKLLLLTTAILSREKRIFQFLRITVNFSVVWLRRNAFEAGKAFFRSQSKLQSYLIDKCEDLFTMMYTLLQSLVNFLLLYCWCLLTCWFCWLIYISLLLAYIMLSRPARNKRLAAQVVIDVVTRITALLLCYC